MSNACNYTTLLLSEHSWEVPEWPLFLMHAQKKADRQSLTLTIIIIVGAIINQMLSSQFLKFPPTLLFFFDANFVQCWCINSQLHFNIPVSTQFHGISENKVLGKISNHNIFTPHRLYYHPKKLFLLKSIYTFMFSRNIWGEEKGQIARRIYPKRYLNN